MAKVGRRSVQDIPKDTLISDTDPSESVEQGLEAGTMETFVRPGIPEPPSRVIRVDKQHEFFKYMEKLKPEHWTGLLMYMYRWYPRVDLQLRPDGTIDQTAMKSVDAIGKSIDEDWILREHGSGMYQFILKQGERTVLTANVEMDNPEFPPKINLWQLDLNSPKNKPFVRRLQAEGKLTPDGKPAVPEGPAKTEGQTATEMLGKVTSQLLEDRLRPKESGESWHLQTLKILTDVYEKAQQNIGRGDDPAKLLGLVNALKDFIKPVELPKTPDNTPLYEKMMDMQSKAHDAQMQFMNRLLEMQTNMKKPEPGDGILGSLEQLGKLKDGLAALGIGGGEEGAPSRKLSTLEVIVQAAAPVLQEVAGVVKLVVMRSMGAMPGKVPVVNPAGATAPGTAAPGAEGMEQIMAPSIDQIVTEYSPMLIGMLERDKDGFDMAELVDTMLGTTVYDQVAALGPDKILELLKSKPEVWSRVSASEDRVKKFIAEFIEWGEPAKPKKKAQKVEKEKA